jgi:hypothetical protein
VADVLTLSDARAALRLPSSDTSRDGDITGTYIPAVTTICESIAGPIMTATGRTKTYNGGAPALLLPSAVTAVTSLTQSGQTLTPGSDYTVDLAAGLVYSGIFPIWTIFIPGYQTLTVTYNVGYAATPDAVTAAHKLGARIILAHLWQADQQGARPQFGQPDSSVIQTPVGYLVPKRAYELLRPTAAEIPGFA